MSRLRLTLLAALALLSTPVQADVVRANATTLFYTRQDWYAGDLQRASPIFELVSITASEVTSPFAQDVEIALSTWGALDLSDVRAWQNGGAADRRFSGDVDTAYIKGELLSRRLVLRVGRQLVSEGVARMVHLDGAQFRLRLPGNFGLSAYAGTPVSPRFAGRGGEFATGNTRANFATGGRVSWFWPGLVELGASAALDRDRGDVARKDVGADLRLTLPRHLELVSSAFYSVPEERWGEIAVAGAWRGRRDVQVIAEYRHVEPDLFLPRTSILSVFAEDERDDVGATVRLAPLRTVQIDVEYTELFERDGNGHRARVKGVWHPRQAWDVGAEAALLNHQDNAGYWLARAFAAWRRNLLEVTGDVMAVVLDRKVNDETLSLTATGTAGYRFAPGWKVLVAGTGGTDPFLVRHFDVLAKLVYDQTYVKREVP
jgi:hypothetical protein